AEIFGDAWMSVYPNPSSETFTVSSSKYPIESIRIFNTLGENVFSKNVNFKKAEVTIPEIATGIYQLQIVTSAGIVNRKIVIAR
ncbi:MAG: T9SS type A sorting domain-containing protein, partial [Bacteroidetes bacterium]